MVQQIWQAWDDYDGGVIFSPTASYSKLLWQLSKLWLHGVNIVKLQSVVTQAILPALLIVLLLISGCQKRTEPNHLHEARPVSAETAHFHGLIANGSVNDVVHALESGVDVNAPGRMGNTALMVAIEAQSIEKCLLLLEHGADPELSNDFNTTALGFAIQYDFIPAIRKLIDLGVDRGYQPKYPQKPVQFDFRIDDMAMPEELLPLMSEAEWKSTMKESMGWANQATDPLPAYPLIKDVQSLEALRILVDAGDRLGDAPQELKRELLGLPSESEFKATMHEFTQDQTRRFGRLNPEPMSSVFWSDMVRMGGNGYAARKHFLPNAMYDTTGPMWCNDRFGASLTELPDGRFVQIGGEHEDYYDPDFCIYNDVIVFDGKGGFQIYGYGPDTFPPTDFHSATRVGDFIYVVGSLGYVDERKFGTTPVYRLNVTNLEMDKVQTSGDSPGWIHKHLARFDEASNSIRVLCGEIQSDKSTYAANVETFMLNLDNNVWSRVAK